MCGCSLASLPGLGPRRVRPPSLRELLLLAPGDSRRKVKARPGRRRALDLRDPAQVDPRQQGWLLVFAASTGDRIGQRSLRDAPHPPPLPILFLSHPLSFPILSSLFLSADQVVGDVEIHEAVHLSSQFIDIQSLVRNQHSISLKSPLVKDFLHGPVAELMNGDHT